MRLFILALLAAFCLSTPAMALGKAGGKDQRIEKRLVKMETRRQKVSAKTGKIAQFRAAHLQKRELRKFKKLSPEAQQQVLAYASGGHSLHGWGWGPGVHVGIGWGNGWGNGWGHGPWWRHGPGHGPHWRRARA